MAATPDVDSSGTLALSRPPINIFAKADDPPAGAAGVASGVFSAGAAGGAATGSDSPRRPRLAARPSRLWIRRTILVAAVGLLLAFTGIVALKAPAGDAARSSSRPAARPAPSRH